MTDRINALIVALESDIRDDDVESLREAIRHFRGVAGVTLNEVSPSDYVARQRIANALREAVFKALENP